jgi:hypothetical protein
VRALVRHLVGQDLRNFLVVARGGTAEWQAPADEPGEDWGAAFRDRAAQLMAVWRAADLEEQVALPGAGGSRWVAASISRSPSWRRTAGT